MNDDLLTDAPAKPRRKRRAPGEANGERREGDVYDTDPAVALACLEWLRDKGAPGGRILEPTAGTGPFVAAARIVFPSSKIVAVDIQESYREPCTAAGADRFFGMDVRNLPPDAIAACDLIVSNPPFKLADDLVRAFWPHMKVGASLAFLLSVTFLAGQDRWDPEAGLYALAPLSHLGPIVPRPQFPGFRSGPKFEAALFVWTKGEPGMWSPIRWKKGEAP